MVDVQKVPMGKRALKGQLPRLTNDELVPQIPIGSNWLGLKWFVSTIRHKQTPPGQKCEDVLAAEALDAMGVVAWYPTERERVRHGARLLKTKLLFPGYLFIGHDGDLAKFNATTAVRHLDCFLCEANGGEVAAPLRVPGWMMQALFAGEEKRQRQRHMESDPLKPGESVAIMDGPFAQFDAKVARLITATRVQVFLEMLGSCRPVEIPVDSLARL